MSDEIEKGISNQALMRMRMNEYMINIQYFIFLFEILLKEESNRSSNGSAIKNIPPFEILKKIRIPSPPLPEQQAIVTYLDQKTIEIDNTISKYQRQIDLLREYKTSLITQVVTGKIKVVGDEQEKGEAWQTAIAL